jgi:hypothetical protein
VTNRSFSLEVKGLREATGAMRKVKGQTVKEVSQYHKQVAEFVAQDARSKAQTRPRTTRTGHTAAAIRTRGTQREAAIRVVTPDAYVQEFGGRAPLFGNKNRWFTVRPKQKGGYFLFPAVKENRDRISRFYLKGLESAIARYWAK